MFCVAIHPLAKSRGLLVTYLVNILPCINRQILSHKMNRDHLFFLLVLV